MSSIRISSLSVGTQSNCQSYNCRGWKFTLHAKSAELRTSATICKAFSGCQQTLHGQWYGLTLCWSVVHYYNTHWNAASVYYTVYTLRNIRFYGQSCCVPHIMACSSMIMIKHNLHNNNYNTMITKRHLAGLCYFDHFFSFCHIIIIIPIIRRIES